MPSHSVLNPFTEVLVFYCRGDLDKPVFSEVFMRRYHDELISSGGYIDDHITQPMKIGDMIATKLVNNFGIGDIGENIYVVIYPKDLQEHIRFDGKGTPFVDYNSYIVSRLFKITVNTGEAPSSMVLVRQAQAKTLDKQARWL